MVLCTVRCDAGVRDLAKGLRLEMMSRMSHTAMQEVFIKTVHTVRTTEKIVCVTDQSIPHV